MKQMQR